MRCRPARMSHHVGWSNAPSRRRWSIAPSYLITLFVAGLPGFAAAENWSQFRGPQGNGVSAERGLPENWTAEKNVRGNVFCLDQEGLTLVI